MSFKLHQVHYACFPLGHSNWFVSYAQSITAMKRDCAPQMSIIRLKSMLWFVAMQLTDRTSYNQKPGSLALRLTQFYSDIYMRRAFRSSVLGKKPDQIIFLGDLLDGGPILEPEE